MTRVVRCSLLLCLSLASACSWLAGPSENAATLADLEPAAPPEPSGEETEPVDLGQVEESYRRALDATEDRDLRRRIQVRLAGLELMRAEQEQLADSEAGRYFDQAIAMYRELLEMQGDGADADHLLYQLAKAYALEGRTEESRQALDELAAQYPESPYMAEVQFRRAELAFNREDYRTAEAYYQSVLDIDPESPFGANALYMSGWTQFKQGRYRESLETFAATLDRLTANTQTIDALQQARQNLAEDTLRVMSLAFSYLEGPQSIRQLFAEVGPRSYEAQLYRRLGQHYLDQERYRDSAQTFAQYVDQYPFTEHAPRFSERIVQAYEAGNFPSSVPPAKAAFVEQYGMEGEYWAREILGMRDFIRPRLRQYLMDLANYAHSLAQQLDEEEEQERTEQYANAARWYEAFLQSFPSDPEAPRMQFLLGEAYYESGRRADAVSAYERVAYELADPERGAEAGYAALLALDVLARSDADGGWSEHRVESAIQFADYYPEDARAPRVLDQAAQTLLDAGSRERAMAVARRLANWQPEPEAALQVSAWLVIAQARYDLEQFPGAEAAYTRVLELLPEDREELSWPLVPVRTDVRERLAASIFRQAEARLAADDKAAAIEQLLRANRAAPDSDTAISALFDAAVYAMELERWEQAQSLLLDFRQRYPQHRLAEQLPARLITVYEAREDWQAAAEELSRLAENAQDPERRRQSLIAAAERYEQAGETRSAIRRYRTYANTYSEPLAETLEAANKLAALYQTTEEPEKRRFWLRKLMEMDAGAGSERSDRSRYLAARAATELAKRRYQEFVNVSLALPLEDSLARKRRAMDEAVAAYERILDYEIARFTTEASFRMGEIHRELAQALLESERPAELNELELEQYDILLEEQAFPFEERAIEIHESNAERSWEGIYDRWVAASLQSLAQLLPARYAKEEELAQYSATIY